jgi:hypothetical protein
MEDFDIHKVFQIFKCHKEVLSSIRLQIKHKVPNPHRNFWRILTMGLRKIYYLSTTLSIEVILV